MSRRATSAFEVTAWDQEAYDDQAEGAKLARATVKKAFTGDLIGQSVAELLMCQADDDHAGYVASERVVGQIGDRTGTFVIQHGGLADGDIKTPFGHVVPGSGTGGLQGLRGTASFQHDENGAVFTLDYEFVG